MAPTSAGHVPTAVEEWETPVPLVDTSELPLFPLEVLPEIVRAHAQSVADAHGRTDAAMVAAFALPAVSALTGGRWYVDADRSDWIEYLQVHLCVVSPPSTGKSPALGAMIGPISDLERVKLDAFRVDNAERETRREIDEQQLAEYKRAAAKDSTDLNARRHAEELARHLAENPLPQPPRLMTSDATPEALLSRMADNAGRIAWLSDEGGELFAIMAGRHSKAGASADLSVFLKGYSGGPGSRIVRDRQTTGTAVIDRPALTVGIAAQPDAVRAGTDADKGRGVFARFLWIMPRVEYLDGDQRPDPNPALAERYAELLNRISARADEIGPENPKRLTIHRDAWGHLDPWRHEIRALLAQQSSGMFQEWLGKLRGNTLRVAGLFAVMRDPDTDQVTERDADAAVRFARYCLDHARRLFSEIALSPEQRLAAACLEKIRNAQHSTGGDWRHLDAGRVTLRDVHRAVGSSRYDSDQVGEALRRLEGLGYLRRVEDDRTGKGARVKDLYQVHPGYLLSGPALVEDSEPLF
jgi:hypothetical protein